MTGVLRVETLDSPTALSLLEGRRRGGGAASDVEGRVKGIIDEVRRRGDGALVGLTLKLDGVKLLPPPLRVEAEEMEAAYERVAEEQVSAVELARGRLEAAERDLLARLSFESRSEGVRARRRVAPLRSVGCYVPGGRAPYPSTLIMAAVPAKVAGVPRVVVCSPPRAGGGMDPLLLVAADICGVDEVLRIGGAQAIAALAYGTETIRPVDKIVGPGNVYVSTAKRLVSPDVPVDLPAGPSEVVILADGTADPRLVALDLAAQAEHGAGGVSLLVTTSADLANSVAREFERGVEAPSREGGASPRSWAGCLALVCGDLGAAVGFVNEFAPEHLEVMTAEPREVAKVITTAGLVLVGRYSPASASDYCLGTNHVLPTGGSGRVHSGLSVLDFVRRFSVVECSEEGLSRVRSGVRALAESEGMANHAAAVEARFSEP